MGILGQAKPTAATQVDLVVGATAKEAQLTLNVCEAGVATEDMLLYASYKNKSFDVSSQEVYPKGIFWKPDGTRFFVAGYFYNKIYQYNVSTLWDVGAASYEGTHTADLQDNPVDLWISPDGTKVFIVRNHSVYRLSMSTPWKISSLAQDTGQQFSMSDEETNVRNITFDSTGTRMYACGADANTVFQYDLSTPWDLTTASYTSKSLDVSSLEDSLYKAKFHPSGSILYVMGTGADTIFQYDLSTPWDVSTGSYSGISLDVSSEDTTPKGLFVEASQNKLWMIGTKTIYQYSANPSQAMFKAYLRQSGATGDADISEQILNVTLDGGDAFAPANAYTIGAGEKIVVESDTGSVTFTATGVERDV